MEADLPQPIVTKAECARLHVHSHRRAGVYTQGEVFWTEGARFIHTENEAYFIKFSAL